VSFWLQHGHGKGDRITQLAGRGALDGVILSPAHEGAVALARTADEVRRAGISVVLDPQTYVYSITGASASEHADHGLEFPAIRWSIDPASIESHVQAALGANETLGTTGPFIAPSVLQRGFGDLWTVLALQYARVAERLAAGRETYASLVVEDAALGDWGRIEEWLDVATTLQVAGFYVVVARDATTYPTAWEGQRVANLMRLTYRLSELNGYRILLGYADFDGLCVVAAGAAGIASGWHYSLRLFRSDRWVPGGFGRNPIPRVTSRTLLTPIAARGETEQLLRSALANAVIPEANIRTFLAGGVGRWTNAHAHMHHLLEISAAVRQLDGTASVADRIAALDVAVANARALLGRVQAARITLAASYRPRLEAMASAIDLFRRAESV
jgi:hypothetical protein